MTRHRIEIKPGEKGYAEMPYSEVCMHMRVAGKPMNFLFKDQQYPSVQLLREDGLPFSGPITYGEAGIYYREGEGYYYYRGQNVPSLSGPVDDPRLES